MKIFPQNFFVIVLLSTVAAEKFSAVDELVSLSSNDERLAIQVDRFIEKLEKVIVELKR